MRILRNLPSFFELLDNLHLELPKNLVEARKVVRYGSCRPSSYFQYEFTDSDEKELRKRLSAIYEGKITTTFIVNFAVRFLNIQEIAEGREG